MSKLEDIVPPLELCKRIPAGEFEESVLVWRERIGNISRDDRIKIREPEDISYKVESAEVNYFPAPTLAEILAKLPLGITGLCTVQTWDHRYAGCKLDTSNDIREFEDADRNPAAAALRLWFKVRGNGDVR